MNPQDLDAEAAVIGAMLKTTDAALAVSEVLASGDFADRRHAVVYAAIVARASIGRPHDFISVADGLRAKGTLEDAGGLVYLGQLAADGLCSAASATAYAAIVRDKAMLRIVAQTCEDTARKAREERSGGSAVLDEAESTLFDLRQRGIRAQQRARSYAQLVPLVEEQIEAARRGDDTALSTGLTDLDRRIGGLHAGDLIIVAGRPGMGKSALAANIAEHVASCGRTALLFSMEMGAQQVAMRSMSAATKIPVSVLRDGRLDEDQYRAMVRERAAVSALPMVVDDTPALSPSELLARARREHAKRPLGVVVVDYLQLMQAKAENRTNEVGIISRSLKALAKDLRVPVIALSQLSRGVEGRTNKRPMLSDLRESGSIEQDADIVLLLYRDDYYDEHSVDAGIAEIIIAKQRNGETGSVDATFDGAHCRFYGYAGPPRSALREIKRHRKLGIAALGDA